MENLNLVDWYNYLGYKPQITIGQIKPLNLGRSVTLDELTKSIINIYSLEIPYIEDLDNIKTIIKNFNIMQVNVVNISNNKLPQYETPQSAGVDVRADFSRVTPQNPIKLYGSGEFDFTKQILRLDPGSRALIPTGLYTAIPEGYEIQVRPRSGLSLKKALTCVNCVGTIDADYRNEIGVILINLSHDCQYIENGERIAQFILNKVERIDWNPVESLDKTERNGGFGHTGTK